MKPVHGTSKRFSQGESVPTQKGSDLIPPARPKSGRQRGSLKDLYQQASRKSISRSSKVSAGKPPPVEWGLGFKWNKAKSNGCRSRKTNNPQADSRKRHQGVVKAAVFRSNSLIRKRARLESGEHPSTPRGMHSKADPTKAGSSKDTCSEPAFGRLELTGLFLRSAIFPA